MRHKVVRIGLSILVLFLILILGAIVFSSYVSNQRAAMPDAVTSLESDSLVKVQLERWLFFSPVNQTPTTGFILYPGGLVDEVAYAPNARAIAEAGYLVIIQPMPFNLAVLDINAAADIIDAYPNINHWAIGGHSLGGSMAAAFSDNHPELIDGLVLWASYPAESNDLSNADVQVTSIYGTLDGVTTLQDVAESHTLLPGSTIWVQIQGGNHAQFGLYGEQKGDNPASISQEEQSAQIVAATIALLESIDR